MSGTGTEQAEHSLHDDFISGRKEVFDFIRERLSFNSNRHAADIMRDVFGVDQLIDDAFDLNDMIQSSSQKLFDEIENMLHVLAAGEDVYALTGRDSIPTYRRITGGDINAGRRSAAEDFTIMLLSVDLDHISRPYANIYMRKREIALMPENVKMALGYSNGRILDQLLGGIEADILEKLPQPQAIAYEGGAMTAPRPRSGLSAAFGAVAKRANIKGSFEGRFARVPKCWPPFPGAPENDITARIASAQPVVARVTAPPEFEHVANDTPDFAAAQKDWLKTAYTALQEEHFTAVQVAHDYARRVGLPATWEKAVVEIANDLFFDLRTAMAERLHDSALGKGKTAADGISAGQDWLAHEIAAIDIPARYPDSRNKQVAAEHLAAFWMETARKQTPAQPQQRRAGISKRAP